MQGEHLVYFVFVIFTGAAFLSTLVLYTRQSLLVAYILLGIALGPWGFKVVNDPELVKQVGTVGIIFLLFLLGLHLQPRNLFHMLKKTTLVALVSSLLFALMGYGVSRAFGFGHMESLIVGMAMMFSSTIIGLKLLPTTILHHQHIGEVVISVLLMQDIIAIVVLLVLHGASIGNFQMLDVAKVVLALPGLILVGWAGERFVLNKLLMKFDQVKEYVFLLSIGWCLGMGELAKFGGLSEEIGAFIAGVSLAASPIALYLTESLKPLRDFFLVMFFFSIGASFNWSYFNLVIIPASILAALLLFMKPLLFKVLLRQTGESNAVAWEVGIRLGQASEFSLLVAYLAVGSVAGTAKLISDAANYLIQATTILTFIVSCYWVVWKYPTPLGITESMRQD